MKGVYKLKVTTFLVPDILLDLPVKFHPPDYRDYITYIQHTESELS